MRLFPLEEPAVLIEVLDGVVDGAGVASESPLLLLDADEGCWPSAIGCDMVSGSVPTEPPV